jgi:hypothetical protein
MFETGIFLSLHQRTPSSTHSRERVHDGVLEQDANLRDACTFENFVVTTVRRNVDPQPFFVEVFCLDRSEHEHNADTRQKQTRIAQRSSRGVRTRLTAFGGQAKSFTDPCGAA